MADYFTNVSLIVPVEDPAAAVAELWRIQELLDGSGTTTPPTNEIFEPEQELFALPDFAAESDGVWVHDDVADIDVVADIVCWLLRQPGAPEEFMFEWSSDCSKPRTDAFGGGAVLCTKDGWGAVFTGSSEVQALLREKLRRREEEGTVNRDLMSDEIHKTTFTVEVFSRGPFVTDERSDPSVLGYLGSGSDLAAIDYAITEGDCIGNVQQTHQMVVPPEAVKNEMIRIGNDGSFFDDLYAELNDQSTETKEHHAG